MIKLENVTKIYKGDVVALSDARPTSPRASSCSSSALRLGQVTFMRLVNREEKPTRAASGWRARTSAS
jgi:hypothetical protein